MVGAHAKRTFACVLPLVGALRSLFLSKCKDDAARRKNQAGAHCSCGVCML